MPGNLCLWMEPESIKEYGVKKYERRWARDFIKELENYGIQSILFDVKVPDGSLYFESSKTNAKVTNGYTPFLPDLTSAAKESEISLYPRIVCFLDDIWKGKWSIDRDGKSIKGKVCPTNSDYRDYLLNIITEVLELDGIGDNGGIVLDAIEFVDPDSTGTALDADLCFCRTCADAFFNTYKRNFSEWGEWRCNQINDFVEKIEMRCEVKNVPLGVEIDFDPRKEYAIGLRAECGIDLVSLSQITDFLIFHINPLSRIPTDNETKARRLTRIIDTQIAELREMQSKKGKLKFYISTFGLDPEKSAKLQKLLSEIEYDGLFLHVHSKVDEFITDFKNFGGEIEQ